MFYNLVKSARVGVGQVSEINLGPQQHLSQVRASESFARSLAGWLSPRNLSPSAFSSTPSPGRHKFICQLLKREHSARNILDTRSLSGGGGAASPARHHLPGSFSYFTRAANILRAETLHAPEGFEQVTLNSTAAPQCSQLRRGHRNSTCRRDSLCSLLKLFCTLLWLKNHKI
jgi:hypothetical protein